MAPNDTRKGQSDPSLGDSVVTRAYRAGATELPPPAVDARIRTAARAAVDARSMRRRNFKRWAVPLSIAATVVLSVAVVVEMSKRGAIEHETPVSEFVGASPATPPAAESAPAAREHAAKPERGSAEFEALKPARSAPEAALERKRIDAAAPQTAKKPSAPSAELATGAVSVRADVVGVRASGSPGAYRFSVTIRSADTGCAQYADWWEVVGADGRLLYRRVLLHSHADEQPFERAGGPVPIRSDTSVWVRAHMSTTGYAGVAFKGSVASGFAAATPAPGFAAAVATQPPLPDGCAF
jgi:hypothetical protein